MSAGHLKRVAPAFAIALCAASCLAHDESAIPIEVRDALPTITARICDLDVPLVFDSGDQSALVLQEHVLTKLNAKPTGQIARLGDIKGNIVDAPMYRIPELRLGKHRFTDVIARAEVHHASYPAADVGHHGFIGTSLFQSHEVIVNYRDSTLTLIKRSKDQPTSRGCTGTALPFAVQRWSGEPVTRIDTDLGPITLWWDTASQASMLSERFVQKHVEGTLPHTVTFKRFANGERNLGPIRFDVVDMALPSEFEGLIGHNFFAKHVVCFDFPGRRVVVR